ncbi:ABC transporter substrate-binding protein [Halomicrobium salinisoli]|uniref:ABC transporter substrate-binding protein n=1 Tax=Halomicrobium salinisoli TaxID=2878391 RepID=UPI001CF01656|nr:ABC transporter substrate-binding protein [Halomicrobium salinisoli]
MSSHTRQSRASADVEMAHFWQEGGGKRMLEELFADFHSRNPGVEVTDQANTIDDHGMLIKSQILQESPPPVFVEWPGQNMVPYNEAGALRDVSDLWADNGWAEAFIEGPRERVQMDGSYYGVPIDIHRMNNLFYHVDMVEERGIDPARVDSPGEFLEVLEGCEDGDVIGMEQPMKNPSDVLQLFANIVIGEFGAETYRGITQGETRSYESELRRSVELLDAYADLAREDATFVDMVEANGRFMEGESVFFHQGDWMAGSYEDRADFEYGRDWDHAVFPGTEDVFMLSTDALVAAEGADFDEDARAFLEFMASPGAQKTLNRIKGSIPPRRDVDLGDYPEILREQFRDFEAASHFPAGHALQITPDAFVEAKIAALEFVTTRDVDRTTRALLDAYGN